MDAYLANLDALSGQMVPFLAIAVLFVVQVVWVAAWLSRGRPNPYDFDESETQAMEVLVRDDAALAELDRRICPPTLVAALRPDDPSLPVDLTSKFWRDNPTEPLKPSEIVRWRNITGRYEVIGGGS